MRLGRLRTQFRQTPVMTHGLFNLTLAQAGFRQVAQDLRIVGIKGQSLPQPLTGLLILTRFESQPA
jgi:hypothetical protein